MELELSLAPEPLFYIGGLAFTNCTLNTLLVDILLIVASVIVYRHGWNLLPDRLQSMVGMGMEFILKLCTGTAGEKVGRRIFPLVGTFFIFILVANWSGLLPGYGVLTVHNSQGHEVPLLRPANSDLNTTLALALVSIASVQALSINVRGLLGYIREFFEPISPVSIILAPVHVVSEISHLLSLSIRLFGNIFAAETLAAVMYFITPYIVPAMLGLEVLFGFIQAMIFTVLSISYIALATGVGINEASPMADARSGLSPANEICGRGGLEYGNQ